jgi:repressor LexA
MPPLGVRLSLEHLKEATLEILTDRQKQVLDFITGYVEKNGYPPALRDIAAHLAINGTFGVMKHLDALERKGYIRRGSGDSRGIALVHAAHSVSLPVVGEVRAGALQPAIEDIEGYFSVDQAHLKGGTFFLRVKGDSMVDAAILDGDLALVKSQPTATNGEIVVAMVDGEATLKAFFREKGHIRLQPRNSNMEPIIVRKGKDVAIIGKVVGIFRSIE